MLGGKRNTDFEGAYVAPLLNDYPYIGFHNTDTYVYGTLVESAYDDQDGRGKMTFIVDEIEEGYSPYVAAYEVTGDKINILLIPELFDEIEDIVNEMKIGTSTM